MPRNATAWVRCSYTRVHRFLQTLLHLWTMLNPQHHPLITCENTQTLAEGKSGICISYWQNVTGVQSTGEPKNLPPPGQGSQLVSLCGLFSAACGHPSRPITSKQTWHWNPAWGCSQVHQSDSTGSNQRHCRFQGSLRTLQDRRAVFKACWNRQWCFLWSFHGLGRSCSSPLQVTFIQTAFLTYFCKS